MYSTNVALIACNTMCRCVSANDKEIHRHNVIYLHVHHASTKQYNSRSVWLSEKDGQINLKNVCLVAILRYSSKRWWINFFHFIHDGTYNIRTHIRDDIKYFVLYSAHIKRIYLFCAASVCVSRHRCSIQSGVVGYCWSLPVPTMSHAKFRCDFFCNIL